MELNSEIRKKYCKNCVKKKPKKIKKKYFTN